MSFLLTSSETFGNQLLGLTLANFTCILYASPCVRDFIIETTMTKISKDSNKNETKREALKIRLCLTFDDIDLSLKSKASTPRDFKSRLIASVRTEFALIATPFSKPCIVLIIKLQARKHNFLYQKKVLNAEKSKQFDKKGK